MYELLVDLPPGESFQSNLYCNLQYLYSAGGFLAYYYISPLVSA